MEDKRSRCDCRLYNINELIILPLIVFKFSATTKDPCIVIDNYSAVCVSEEPEKVPGCAPVVVCALAFVRVLVCAAVVCVTVCVLVCAAVV